MSLFEVDLTTQDLFKIAQFFSDQEGTCFLYSGGSYDSAERSFIFLFPYEILEVSRESGWETLKKRICPGQDWVGFLGYEMGGCSDPEKKIDLPYPLTPDAYFQRCAVTIEFMHYTGKARISCLENRDFFCDREAFLDFVSSLPAVNAAFKALSINAPETLEAYSEKIKQAQELIHNGDIYQINLSHQMEYTTEGNPFSFFYSLSAINPAPFSAYFRFKDFTIVSSSPERLLQKKGKRLETRPIKGTIPRGKTREEDKINREALLASTKDRAELLMITDLMRNDLGKISLPGSVMTEKLIHCEAYSNVYHLLSVISSKSENYHPVDIVRACFPGGSVTGCPKLSAMGIIADLEKRSRGIYTGSIGYFAANGDFDFNIAIRTLVFSGKKMTLQLGGAIVADSIPEKEYEETLAKGRSVFQSLELSKL